MNPSDHSGASHVCKAIDHGDQTYNVHVCTRNRIVILLEPTFEPQTEDTGDDVVLARFTILSDSR